ncbi:BTB/POZ domain-containing protein 9-like protein, partial [Dinothrombium tinctorium]
CLFDEKHVGNELILDTSKQSFLVALKFMYTGEIEFDNIDDDHLIELFSLSNSLQIKPLVDLVEHRLNGIEISTKNVGKIYAVLNANNATLLNKCWQFIEQNSESVIADSDSFSKFPYDLILEIVKSDTFFAAEIDIFNAIVEWHKNNENAELTESLLSL